MFQLRFRIKLSSIFVENLPQAFSIRLRSGERAGQLNLLCFFLGRRSLSVWKYGLERYPVEIHN